MCSQFYPNSTQKTSGRNIGCLLWIQIYILPQLPHWCVQSPVILALYMDIELNIDSHNDPYLARQGEIWGVFCGFKFTFCLSYHTDVCNILLYWHSIWTLNSTLIHIMTWFNDAIWHHHSPGPVGVHTKSTMVISVLQWSTLILPMKLGTKPLRNLWPSDTLWHPRFWATGDITKPLPEPMLTSHWKVLWQSLDNNFRGSTKDIKFENYSHISKVTRSYIHVLIVTFGS